MSYRNKNDIFASRKFLLKRGVWLIIVDFTILNLGLFMDFGFHTLIFEVLATIGFGFIILSLLLKLPAKTIGILGLGIICCHNLFPLIPFKEGTFLKMFAGLFFQPAGFPITAHTVFVMAYPPVPWLGIMLAGFACGKFFELPAEKRRPLFTKIGFGALMAFVLLRFINIYGDPVIWVTQKNAVFTFLSFMNVTKYPPSLQFCLVTLGIMFLILAFSERISGLVMIRVSAYGKVPLFYFVVHFYLLHVILIILLFCQGISWQQMDFASGSFGRPKGIESGLSLPLVYLVWAIVVTALYRPVVWFGKYKAEHKQWWLKYI
jgi:uncharacterized membrane protein